jgi:hypothetical protein
MSLECIKNNNCPALLSCDAAEKALQSFIMDYNGSTDKNWETEQTIMIKMRRAALIATAEVIDCCDNEDQDNENKFACPLPFGMTENTAFGNLDEMRRSANTIANANKPIGF